VLSGPCGSDNGFRMQMRRRANVHGIDIAGRNKLLERCRDASPSGLLGSGTGFGFVDIVTDGDFGPAWMPQVCADMVFANEAAADQSNS
jgi:hypothetical protein